VSSIHGPTPQLSQIVSADTSSLSEIYRILPIWQRAWRLYNRDVGNDLKEVAMRLGPFMLIAFLLLIMWAGGFLFFHVAGGLIHLLLLFAVISFVVHFITGTRTA
jgi:Family of unknown function (DUF5670)